MGGKGSGRKSNYECKQIQEIINLSSDIIIKFLQDEKQPTDKKAMLGRDFIIKTIPSKLEGEGFSDKMVFVYVDPKAKEEVASGQNRIASELPSK